MAAQRTDSISSRAYLCVWLLVITSSQLRALHATSVEESPTNAVANWPRSRCLGSERAALLTFKASITDPLGKLESWQAGRDCCQWNGVHCSNSTTTGGSHHVTKLSLPFYGLSGEISSPLSSLVFLRHLDLSGNFMGNSRPIPHFLGSLVHLDISSNFLGGPIPSQLGSLSKLMYLNIGWSDFCWSLCGTNSTDVSWLSRLRKLRHLDVTSWDLSTADANLFPAINILPDLRVLRLSYCNLTSYSLQFHNLSALTVLDLSYNSLQGSFPAVVGNMSSLEELNLGHNRFAGLLPPSWSNLCSLRLLGLDASDIDDDIRKVIEKFGCTWKTVQYLYLSDANVTGSLTAYWIAQLTSVRKLELGGNILTGHIPPEIGRLENLTILYLRNNAFSGNVTEKHFSDLGNLEILDLSENLLAVNLAANWTPPFKLWEVSTSDHVALGLSFPCGYILKRLSNAWISPTIASGVLCRVGSGNRFQMQVKYISQIIN